MMNPVETFRDLHLCLTTTDDGLWRLLSSRIVVKGTHVITDEDGRLNGWLRILSDGSFLFSVIPSRRRQGLGTRLLEAAGKIDWKRSDYSPAGRACVDAFINRTAKTRAEQGT